MDAERVITAAEMEKLSPNERARLVQKSCRDSLDELNPEFRARVEAKSRKILKEFGLPDSEHSEI